MDKAFVQALYEYLLPTGTLFEYDEVNNQITTSYFPTQKRF